MKDLNRAHLYSVYFAPRGRERLLFLGEQLAQIHLSYRDKLVGIVGDAGSGKSLIIKGMFPGLTLTNDDDQINPMQLMQVRNDFDLDIEFTKTTYHIDMRFQMAFTQMYEIVDFVKGALANNRRVIVEHFDLLFSYLNRRADIMVGIGEEIIVTRPNMFGPVPKDLYEIVFNSLRSRKMAHTAEDIAVLILEKKYNLKCTRRNRDVRKGFVLSFVEKPEFDINELENEIKIVIDKNLNVSYVDENHIKIGNAVQKCTGPRIHIRNTKEIEDFQLVKEIKYDEETEVYVLIGLINCKDYDVNDLNKIKREYTS